MEAKTSLGPVNILQQFVEETHPIVLESSTEGVGPTSNQVYEDARVIFKSLSTTPTTLENVLDPIVDTDPLRAFLLTSLLLEENEINLTDFPVEQKHLFDTFCKLLPTAAESDSESTVTLLNDLFGRAMSEEHVITEGTFYKENDPGYKNVVLGDSALTAENIDKLYKIIEEIKWPETVNLGTVNSWYERLKSRGSSAAELANPS